MAAAAAEVDSLQLYWDHFFRAETGAYEKSTWLDLFLAEFLIRLNEGCNPKELIRFCPVSGVVSLVGCELLCGIHRVTSSVNAVSAHCPQPQPQPHLAADDAAADNKPEGSSAKPTSLFSRTNAQSSADILRKYLLGGVPWRGLVLLKALGVEGLSCCRQLSSVLVWLFGELSAANGSTAQRLSPALPALPAPVAPPRPPIYHLFSNRIWSKQKFSPAPKMNSVATSERGSATGRLRYNGQTKLDSDKLRKWSTVESEQSTESGDSNDDLQVLNRSMTIKVCSPNDDFEYFNSPLRSANEFPNDTLYGNPYSLRKTKPKADDYMTEKHKEIISSEISTFEFTLLITDLLQELCKAESSLSGSEGSQISMQCINFSLKNLCTLQFGSLPAQSIVYEALELSRIKVALTELLIVSLDQVLIHSDLCAKLINNGILPMLLRILEDVICKSSAKYNTKNDNQHRAKDVEKPNETESQNLLKFVFGIAYSITAFFHCLLMQCRSVDKLREFTDQFKLYGECLKGGLLKECMELMIRIPGVHVQESVLLIKKLIESTGKLISGMKRVRSEVIHSAACPRSRHKACRVRVSAGMHHHHDILGEAGTALPLPSACCISVLYGTLTSLVPDDEISAQKVLRNKILHVMLKCGVCCCFSPSILMESIVRLMLTHNSVATLCLQLLEHTVYGDLGASILIPRVTDQLPCSICEPCDENRDLTRKYCPHSPIERKSMWSFLIHYNSLLQLDNHNNVLHATVSHLLKVTPKCRMEMKYELLFSVIYPTFIVSKHRYTIKLEDAAYFLTVSCLNIFASLLNTVPFAEQFIQKGGLSYVLELISLPEFSNQCCAILEIAITVEIFKLMKENAELTYYREISSLSSVQMLFKSLNEMTEKCYKIYKTKLPAEKFIELCDVNKEQEMLEFSSHTTPARKSSTPIVMKNIYSGEIVDDGKKDHVEILKNVLTFWQSCSGLCLYSPMFREYMVTEVVFLDSYALLKLTLHYLCDCECPPAESRVLIKIMEALLTVQFAVSEVTSQRSTRTSCGVVRQALRARAPGAPGAPGGMRALCAALVGVAVPGRHRAATCFHSLKVPPLPPLSGAGAGASSAECSSSECSEESAAAGPYASDHSEPRAAPDDGYEADVEVGKLDLSCTTRKVSEVVSAMSAHPSMSGLYRFAAHAEGALATGARGTEPAHPELCAIVIDILAQLIDRLLSGEAGAAGEAEGEELERVCCGVARACCTRLASGAAPPLLLARLLVRGAPAARLLSRTDKRFAELQRSILELVVAVGGARLASRELASLLQLFAADAPPAAALLATLRQLLPPPADTTPDYALHFPLLCDEHDESGPNGVTLQHADAAEAGARPLRGWPHAEAAAHARVEGAAWAPWLQGFAVLLWLQPHAARQEAGELHVLALGHDSLMFELWLHAHSGQLTVRLTRPEPGGGRLVGEARSATTLPRRWSCVALNVAELVHKRRIHIQVTLFINGRECETMSLPLQGILVRKVSPVSVYLGQGAHAGRGECELRGGYQLSTVRVFRAPVLSAPAALHLAAHGPDQPCQIRCESPNFSSIITPELLDMDIDWDQVYDISPASLRELHDSALLAFLPHAPSQLLLYHPPGPVPTVFGGRTSVGCGAPEQVRLRWARADAPAAVPHEALAPALLDLGGPDLLLYLFARMMELDGSAEEQAAALGALLRACGGDARLRHQLHTDTLDMLQPLLASERCRVSHHLLKVILDEACSGSVVVSSGDTVTLLAGADSVLLEPQLLVLLVRSWRQFDNDVEIQWEVIGERLDTEEDGCGGRSTRGGGRGTSWALALAALRVLLRAAHPRRPFNLLQAARIDLLRHLLLACKERFLNSECPPLDAATSHTLVEVVRALMGEPPLLCNLALLCDFLLLMHQASDTFVTHSRANFYFLLTADTPETSEFNFLALLGKRKQRDKWRLPDSPERLEPERSSSSSVSEDTLSRSSLNDLMDVEHLDTDVEHEKTDSEHNAESTKQMKGIINMHIKEARSHTSTNSIHSDISTEDGGAGRADEVLTEYIVVDVEEVSHTTVDVYTSGIYQQRRVRAGAEPGWSACEGLLLLLRDTILALPDAELTQAACGAIQPEWLVVLANHRSAAVRAAVVRAAAALQARAPALLAAALGGQCYMHLANQISLYPGSWELVAACAALLTKCDVPLEDQLDADIWMDVGAEAAARSPPLLALLPACVDSVPLAHNIVAMLRRLVDKSSPKALAEAAVAEVTVRALRAASLLPTGAEGRALLLHELTDLLARLALHPAAHPQAAVDIHNMLTYVEQEQGAGGAEGAVVRAARDAQATLYCAQLDHLEERLRDAYANHHKQTNYFTNVLSSAMEGGLAGRARTDLSARHASTLARAVTFLLTRSPRQDLAPEADFFERIFNTLLMGVCGAEARLRWFGGAAECAGALHELLWWALAPAAGARALQPCLLRTLSRAPRDVLAHLTPRDPPANRKLSVYLTVAVQAAHSLAARAPHAALELAVTDWARDWAVRAQAPLPDRLPPAALPAEAARLRRADEQRWARSAHAPRTRASIGKSVFAREVQCGRACEAAMGATRRVVEAQNSERKTFLDHLRASLARAAAAAQRALRRLTAHTHERAVWYSARGQPMSWALDSTEGPGRVRVRLRRAHLRIPPRCLQPRHRHKAESASMAGPLRSVLGGGVRGGAAARLQLAETVAYMARVTHVTVASETPGELLLTDRCIHFVPEEEVDDAGDGCGVGAECVEAEALCVPLEALVRAATRRWCLQERALELFLHSGRAHLLAFPAAAERAAFLDHLAKLHLPDKSEPETLNEAMSQWRNGTITNWEYLMTLNGLAGRSYNDLMQYPVLPFVLADYTSRILDLTDPGSFRDLGKPMAVQNKNREQHYINTYNDLRAARREGCSPLARQPHHYASLYSNSGGVLHYLVRVPPFTELFLNYQDNNFDMPDRTFHSLATTWRLITNDSPTDVKELIPELFYLPELFYNNEGLELGVRQCGARVDAVTLPRWAADARLFTLLHRQALEAPYVADHLPLWIDLVFGYKQTGQAAIDAINVFPACTYYGFDPSALEDEVDRTAAAAMVRTYGQAPRQLLRAPHPHRAPDLAHRPQENVGVWDGVHGARWGRYCGSPALPPAAPAARRACPAPATLLALGSRSAALCAADTALLPLHDESITSGNSGGTGSRAEAYGVLSWGHADGALRLRRRRDLPPVALLHVPPRHQITAVGSWCAAGSRRWGAFLGHASGRVTALRVRVPAAGAAPRAHTRLLHAHTAPLVDVVVCARASLLVTASEDGILVLWDLNELSYIRTLPNRDMLPVRRVAVSETLSDVASVHSLSRPASLAPPSAAPPPPPPADYDADNDIDDSYEKDAAHKYKSLIRVHTVNASFVGSVKVSELVTSMCYSNAAEGVSVNCIAAGLDSGAVRLYSSWDLRPVALVPPPARAPQPAPFSLTYSTDSSILFASYADGAVVAWESAEPGARAAPLRLLPAHALL